MRLIEKVGENTYGALVENYLVYEKLCQLEDIEEELGVNLNTLLTAKKVWCEIEMLVNGEIKPQIIQRNLVGINLQDKTIMVGNTYRFSFHKLKDYGKTWALTKEEEAKQYLLTRAPQSWCYVEV